MKLRTKTYTTPQKNTLRLLVRLVSVLLGSGSGGLGPFRFTGQVNYRKINLARLAASATAFSGDFVP